MQRTSVKRQPTPLPQRPEIVKFVALLPAEERERIRVLGERLASAQDELDAVIAEARSTAARRRQLIHAEPLNGDTAAEFSYLGLVAARLPGEVEAAARRHVRAIADFATTVKQLAQVHGDAAADTIGSPQNVALRQRLVNAMEPPYHGPADAGEPWLRLRRIHDDTLEVRDRARQELDAHYESLRPAAEVRQAAQRAHATADGAMLTTFGRHDLTPEAIAAYAIQQRRSAEAILE